MNRRVKMKHPPGTHRNNAHISLYFCLAAKAVKVAYQKVYYYSHNRRFTMNIFKFLSVIMTALSEFTIEICDALTTSAAAVNNCAKMAETTTDAMLKETELDNEYKLKEIEANHAKEQFQIPLTQ